MKKLLLFFAIVILAGCSSDDDKRNIGNDKKSMGNGVGVLLYDFSEEQSPSGVEILHYDYSGKQLPSGIYNYSIDVTVKNHDDEVRDGKHYIYMEFGSGNKLEYHTPSDYGYHRLQPYETKTFNYDLYFYDEITKLEILTF